MTVKKPIPVVLAVALVAVACGGNSDPAGSDDTTAAPPTTLIVDEPPTTTTAPEPEEMSFFLQVTEEGGFAPIEFLLNRPPTYTAYEDGGLFSPAPTAAIFPGPMLPAFQFVNIGDEGVAEILALVDEMGLPEIEMEVNSEATARVADATTTVVTFRDESGDHVYGVYALGLTDEFSTPRDEALMDLLELLGRLIAEGDDPQIHEPDTLVINVREAEFEPEIQDTRPWPLSVAPDELDGDIVGFSCAVLEDEDAAEALAAFSEATQVTLWDYQGTEYQILSRPLLPGEVGCEDPRDPAFQ